VQFESFPAPLQGPSDQCMVHIGVLQMQDPQCCLDRAVLGHDERYDCALLLTTPDEPRVRISK